MGLGGAKRSRSPSDASPVAFCLLCRHGQSRSPPALRPQARFGAQPPRQRRLLARRWRRNSPAGNCRKPERRAEVVAQASFSCLCGAIHLLAPYKGIPKFAPSSVWPDGQPPSPQGEGFRAVRTPPLRRKRRLWGAPVGHSGVPKWAGFPPPPAGRAPLAHKFLKTGHQGPPGGAGSGWPLKKR